MAAPEHRDGALRLYSAFHANLDFSSLPEIDLSLVVERCYWPLLEIFDDLDLPLGLEMPARSLEILQIIDPEFQKALRVRIEMGRVELIGSGLAQIIAPLVPADVNEANFAEGLRRYEELAGVRPTTWFVNEQTLSRGILPLYARAGAERLVVEWNNPASAQPSLRDLRTTPARIDLGTGPGLEILWNDSVVFGRVQQCVHGTRAPHAARDLVRAIEARHGSGALCLYGGDLEIFDYRPGRPPSEHSMRGEMRRLRRLIEELSAEYEMILPREVGAFAAPGPMVDLVSASDPMPCKKQPRYNPTRWALSGRDGIGMNTQCHALRRAQHAVARLEGASAVSNRRELIDLWRSDFRTRATEEKIEAFHAQMGAALRASEEALETLMPDLAHGSDLRLENPWEEDWVAYPVEVDLRFAPGRLSGDHFSVIADSEPARWQLVPRDRHRDGSLRRATLVGEPTLEAGASLCLRVVADPSATARAEDARENTGAAVTLASQSAAVALRPARGAAIEALTFPRLGAEPLAGTLDGGSYHEMAYSPDFYSGHVVAYGEDGQKVTDLIQGTAIEWRARGPVRDEARVRIATPFGEWTKEWHLYHHRPRLTLHHFFRFPALRLASLRLGQLTLRPDAWARDKLVYASVQGGRDHETFPLLPGAAIDQGRTQNPAVTASGCLGATEGWCAVGDGERGIAWISDPASAALLPMLRFAEVDDSFFLRVEHSAAERDETRAAFVRGIRHYRIAIEGFGGDPAAIRPIARAAGQGLLARTAEGVSFARGL